MKNGMFIFRFNDEPTCEAVLEEDIWHVANKPFGIEKKLEQGMQVLKS